MSQEDKIKKATEIAKTVEGRAFKGVSQLDVDLVQAGYAQALKDAGELLEAFFMLKEDTIVVSGKTLTEVLKRVVEALKRGEMPKKENSG